MEDDPRAETLGSLKTFRLLIRRELPPSPRFRHCHFERPRSHPEHRGQSQLRRRKWVPRPASAQPQNTWPAKKVSAGRVSHQGLRTPTSLQPAPRRPPASPEASLPFSRPPADSRTARGSPGNPPPARPPRSPPAGGVRPRPPPGAAVEPPSRTNSALALLKSTPARPKSFQMGPETRSAQARP